jgi:cobalamin biosynthesis protein CobW
MTKSYAKTPCTIVTGFLGAGKTTLVRNLIETANGRRLAIIVNEFGDVGIDGDILKGCGVPDCPEDRIVELSNGCLCCTVADDFVPALKSLLDQKEPPEHIVIETSGLALPKPLVQAFNWPEIATRVTVDGVVAVVDGPAVAAGRFADDPEALAAQRAADDSLDHDNPLEEVYEDQLLCADLVVMNKSDLLSEQQRKDVAAEIAAKVQRAVKVIATEHGRLSASVLLGLGAAAEQNDFESFVLDVPAQSSPDALVDRIAAAVDAHDVLRVKGFVEVAGKPLRLLVQAVGNRIQHQFERPWRAGDTRPGRLVVIGERGLDAAAIQSLIAG